jgi:hypothetical protein
MEQAKGVPFQLRDFATGHGSKRIEVVQRETGQQEVVLGTPSILSVIRA